jgi:hypothetical protein
VSKRAWKLFPPVFCKQKASSLSCRLAVHEKSLPVALLTRPGRLATSRKKPDGAGISGAPGPCVEKDGGGYLNKYGGGGRWLPGLRERVSRGYERRLIRTDHSRWCMRPRRRRRTSRALQSPEQRAGSSAKLCLPGSDGHGDGMKW